MLLHTDIAKERIAKHFQAEHFDLSLDSTELLMRKIKRSINRLLAPIPPHTVKEAELTIKSIDL